MKQYSRLISLVGGVISFFSFALPWVEDSSGFKLANISSSNSNVGFVVIVFIVTLIIIVTSLILNRQTFLKVLISRIIVMICCGIGLFCLSYLFSGQVKIYGNYVRDIQYGAYLNTIGFIISIVGIWNHPTTKDIPHSEEE